MSVMPQEDVMAAQEIIRDLLGDEVELTFEDEFPLSEVDEQPLQIRGVVAPKKNVDAFAVQMEYSTFPPLVITSDHVLADGHTRLHARRQRGETHDRAVIVSIAWNGSDEITRRRIQLIGQVINNTGGERLNADETRSMVANCLAIGYNYDRTAAMAGVSKSTIRAVEKELRAESRLKAVGLVTKPMKPTVTRAVGEAAKVLHDQPFADLVTLAADARLKSTEIRELTRQMVDQAKSDEEAVSLIAARRESEASRITRNAESGNGQAPLSQQLGMHLGWINNPDRTPADMIEPRPSMQADYLARVQSAAARLAELVTLQQEAMK